MKFTEKQINEVMDWILKHEGEDYLTLDFGDYELDVQDLDKNNLKDLIKNILFRLE